MRCIECRSAAVTERAERTAQGYRRFRCRSCGKQFNERSGTVLNRAQYPSDIVALVASSCGNYEGCSLGAIG
jgi:putative transposase